jgi:cell division protein FtsW
MAAAPAPAALPAVLPAERHDDAGTLLALVLALVSVGIVMVWSTSALDADRMGDPTFFLRRQVLWSMLAAIGLGLAWATDYQTVLRWRNPIGACLLVALVGVLFTPAVKGAHRWFDLGGMNVQPSEPAKLAVIIFLASRASNRERLQTMRGAAEAVGALGLVAGLILLEKDLGTFALVATTGGIMLLVAGMRIAHLALMAAPLALGAVAYAATRFQHVQTRLSVFMNPDADPQGKGYQIRQALIALGSGGPTGLGLGDSKQKLFFLPDDHTDFIFSILGEELGLVGTLAVTALFAAFVVFGFRIALNAKHREGFLVAVGVTTVIGLQAAFNIAVVTATVPTKGISLPFVSFGGSSLLCAMTGVGMLLNVAQQSAGASASAGCDEHEYEHEIEHEKMVAA